VWGGGRVHAILGRHLTDAKGCLKRQILKHGQMLQSGEWEWAGKTQAACCTRQAMKVHETRHRQDKTGSSGLCHKTKK